MWSNLPWCRPGKNWSVVRRIIGYRRYDTHKQVDLLNRLYARYRLYINFFLPVTKLKEKVRTGSHLRRLFDAPQTPYARMLASPSVSESDKVKLKEEYAGLDVVELRAKIEKDLDDLLASHPR